MEIRIALRLALAVVCAAGLGAQTADNTVLKQVIVFGRHAARTPAAPAAVLSTLAVRAYPAFAVTGQSVITPNGRTNETLLGNYFRLWLTKEKLLTGSDGADAGLVYARAYNSPLIVDTAEAFLAGLLPAAAATVHTVDGADPLFDPINAGVAKLDTKMALAAVSGRLGGNAQALATAYAAEFALARAVLFDYAAGTTPAPATPAGKVDVTALPITLAAGNATTPVALGGLAYYYYATDPFLMQYVDGMATADVAWGRLDAGGIGQLGRVYNALINLEYRTPYLARVQSSNLASHVVRTLVQSATGTAMSGALGSPADKVIVLISTDSGVSGLAGLLELDWLVAGYQPDVAAPGGALVFELRQSQRSGEFVVRARYVTQTLEQLRNRTALTLAAPPASVPVFIPSCSTDNATMDCRLSTLVRKAQQSIDARSADLKN
jgi:4-phytase/acid phosphatase